MIAEAVVKPPTTGFGRRIDKAPRLKIPKNT